jgi:hypothetical protein
VARHSPSLRIFHNNAVDGPPPHLVRHLAASAATLGRPKYEEGAHVSCKWLQFSDAEIPRKDRDKFYAGVAQACADLQTVTVHRPWHWGFIQQQPERMGSHLTHVRIPWLSSSTRSATGGWWRTTLPARSRCCVLRARVAQCVGRCGPVRGALWPSAWGAVAQCVGRCGAGGGRWGAGLPVEAMAYMARGHKGMRRVHYIAKHTYLSQNTYPSQNTYLSQPVPKQKAREV